MCWIRVTREILLQLLLMGPVRLILLKCSLLGRQHADLARVMAPLCTFRTIFTAHHPSRHLQRRRCICFFETNGSQMVGSLSWCTFGLVTLEPRESMLSNPSFVLDSRDLHFGGFNFQSLALSLHCPFALPAVCVQQYSSTCLASFKVTLVTFQ